MSLMTADPPQENAREAYLKPMYFQKWVFVKYVSLIGHVTSHILARREVGTPYPGTNVYNPTCKKDPPAFSSGEGRH
jgi:hypothetical protein